jgi:hypothetical protein
MKPVIFKQLFYSFDIVNISVELSEDTLRLPNLFPGLFKEVGPVFNHLLKVFISFLVDALPMLSEINCDRLEM